LLLGLKGTMFSQRHVSSCSYLSSFSVAALQHPQAEKLIFLQEITELMDVLPALPAVAIWRG